MSTTSYAGHNNLATVIFQFLHQMHSDMGLAVTDMLLVAYDQYQ